MAKNTENVRTAFENIARFPDFQAEYEGSIPFTRSILRFPAPDYDSLRSGSPDDAAWGSSSGAARCPMTDCSESSGFSIG
jgi:hypothetical protein